MQHLSHEYNPKGMLSHRSLSDQPNIIQQGGEEDSDDDDSVNNKPGKRTGRRKIKIEYIQDKSRRHISFSKRKAGIMKKAYELSTLTGTQVLLLVVSETGLVYTFTTPKLQPLVTKPEGKNLIQSCLNAPDSHDASHHLPHPPASPKPSHSGTTNMIKSESYTNGSTHQQHGSNHMYSQHEVAIHHGENTKVPLSHSSNYHQPISDNYPHQANYRQDVTNHHPYHQQQYSSPSTPYPSYSEAHPHYPPTHLPSY